MNVGARPWQILHQYPKPEPVPMDQVPFEVNFENIDRLHPSIVVKPLKMWIDLPLSARRVAAAIALDMCLPMLLRSLPPGEENEDVNNFINLVQEWIYLMENYPAEVSERKDTLATRLSRINLDSILTQLELTEVEFNAADYMAVAFGFTEALDSSIDDYRHSVPVFAFPEYYLTSVVWSCIPILSGISLHTGTRHDRAEPDVIRYTYYYNSSPAYVGDYEVFLDAINDDLWDVKNWFGIWWQEFMNTYPLYQVDDVM